MFTIRLFLLQSFNDGSMMESLKSQRFDVSSNNMHTPHTVPCTNNVCDIKVFA